MGVVLTALSFRNKGFFRYMARLVELDFLQNMARSSITGVLDIYGTLASLGGFFFSEARCKSKGFSWMMARSEH